jgi:acyl dehydratase
MSFADSTVSAAAPEPSSTPSVPAPFAVGDSCLRALTFTPESIAEFARLTGDANPLHLDAQAAARSHHGRIIASGQQTTSQMIGLAATHFSRGDAPDAAANSHELLCLNFNFALKSPVFAGATVEVSWQVSAIDWHTRLRGWLVHVDGKARSQNEVCVVARGTLLIKA